MIVVGVGLHTYLGLNQKLGKSAYITLVCIYELPTKFSRRNQNPVAGFRDLWQASKFKKARSRVRWTKPL